MKFVEDGEAVRLHGLVWSGVDWLGRYACP